MKTDKVVLITGGSKGIGKAIVQKISKSHLKIAFSYNQGSDDATKLVSQIEKENTQVLAIQADLRHDAAAANLVKTTIDHFGQIDVLVNNVGGYYDGDEWSGNRQAWEDTLSLNLLSTLSVSKYTLLHMCERKIGTIINIASRFSVSGQADAIAYAASKAAIVNITLSQTKLMKPWGRSNAISPGSVKAGYWASLSEQEIKEELGKSVLLEPEEIANAVSFLTSDQALMITGQNLIVDQGFTLIG